MTHFLQGKKAVVTGGSRGIGLEVARTLLAEGAEVLICGRSESSLQKAVTDLSTSASQGGSAPQPKLFTQTADVANSTEVERLFESVDRHLNGLDILINNAGVGVFRATGELTVEDWDRVIATNLSGAFYCSRAAIARFRRSGSGSIINISSLAGKNPFAGGSAYNASKFGLNGFSEAMMLDHRSDRIRVSYVMPGSVDTAFSGSSGPKADWKIAPEDVAEIVLGILKMPERTLISRVEVRPSRPASH
jgi:NAD(P)-dependent dehydrogenase (short-subunit alcohol dehydrogenase family)